MSPHSLISNDRLTLMVVIRWGKPTETKKRLLTFVNTYFDSSVDLDTPVITLTPPSDTINETEPLSLKCFASGSETDIQYNWFFQDKLFVVNNDTIQFNNVNRSQEGTYRCEASSTVGEKNLTRSITVTITVTCKFFLFMFFISYST